MTTCRRYASTVTWRSGDHPKAGIYYLVTQWELDNDFFTKLRGQFAIDHCPKCGGHDFLLVRNHGLACLSGYCDHTHTEVWKAYFQPTHAKPDYSKTNVIDDPD